MGKRLASPAPKAKAASADAPPATATGGVCVSERKGRGNVVASAHAQVPKAEGKGACVSGGRLASVTSPQTVAAEDWPVPPTTQSPGRPALLRLPLCGLNNSEP